jgi:anaerobic magnesium-protoporphyrin IX monomethyl ester cyclase
VARILLLNPSRWGRGITPIWIASHAAVLKERGHEVALFDATFFRDWSQNENKYNTANLQYRPSSYEQRIVLDDRPVVAALQAKIDAFKPDYVFWAAISSHIHGEGEYAAIQFGAQLMETLKTSAVSICGGLQPTAAPKETAARFPEVAYFIGGESEFVLADLVDALAAGRDPRGMAGVIVRDAGGIVVGPAQKPIHDLDRIGVYDFSLFDDQIFLRPYNGEVVRAVDYELSRGCPFTCSYCVETVIQRYYGLTDATPRGALKAPQAYLRAKSPARVYEEFATLYRDYGVTFVRCQDTNFLTIERDLLDGLAARMEAEPLPISLYVETRPEGINAKSVALMKRLKVDGVGMGIELAGQDFRESMLNRFANQGAILRAFEMLRSAGIRRTAYNIIGLPKQTEQSILDTVAFNRQLDPDNVTVAFYSPYLGTGQQQRGADEGYFLDYEFDLDSQLRTMSRHDTLTPELLSFYKRHFVRLVKEGLERLPDLKAQEGMAA